MNRYLFVVCLATLVISGCKKWDDHIEVKNQDLKINLMEAIASNPDLSKFNEYVGKAGLDTMLRSSKTFTVWAPSNTALAALDPAIVADNAKLKDFLMNHIANQTYFTSDAHPTTMVKMLNGKYHDFTQNHFDSAGITSADRFVRNGVLHVIDKIVPVMPSIWDFINSTAGLYAQNAFITSLNYLKFEPSLATVDSINAITGEPIYKPGTGYVQHNWYSDRVYDLKQENKQFTYFIITDPGWTTEVDSLKNYYKTISTAKTDSLSRWNVAKDLVVEGLYPPNALPAFFQSKFGITVPVNPAFIIETKRMSNGIVYIMSKVDVPTINKFKEITIQGEFPSGFLIDRRSNTNYRVRENPVTGNDYTDIMVTGHGVTSFYAFYRLNEIPSIKYKVYAVGVNDFQTGTFSQNIVAKYLDQGVYTTLATLAHAVPLKTTAGAYDEKLLGEFTLANFGTLEMQLTASATSPIVLDYLRLVPVP